MYKGIVPTLFNILFLVLLTSCSWGTYQQKLAQKEFDRVFDDFKVQALKRNIQLKQLKTVAFINIKEAFPESRDWVGVCSNNDEIYFDQQWWRLSHSLDKEQVILHELAHCLLDLEHQESGIMSIKRIPINDYYKNKQKLIEELFNLYQKQIQLKR